MGPRQASPRRRPGHETRPLRRRLRDHGPWPTKRCGNAVGRGSHGVATDGLTPVGGQDSADPHRRRVRLSRLAHPASPQEGSSGWETLRLHLSVEEVAGFNHRQGATADPAGISSHPRRPAAPDQPGDQRLVRLLSAWCVKTNLQLPRPLRLLAGRRLAEETTRRDWNAHPGPTPPPRLEDPRRRDRVLPRLAGPRDPLPLPRNPHPHTLGERHGVILWRAGCPGMGTSGSEGGQQKPTSRKTGTALLSDPYTYCRSWAGFCYVAFIVDVFAQRIVAWHAATTKTTELVMTPLRMALWARGREGYPTQPGELIHHSDAGSQYTSIRFTEHLALEGIRPSIGSVGDAFDNALMETIIGLFKTECIRTTVFHDGPYKSLADVEYATAGWVDWYNNRRLHGSIGMVPPAEYEQARYAALIPEMQPI